MLELIGLELWLWLDGHGWNLAHFFMRFLCTEAMTGNMEATDYISALNVWNKGCASLLLPGHHFAKLLEINLSIVISVDVFVYGFYLLIGK